MNAKWILRVVLLINVCAGLFAEVPISAETRGEGARTAGPVTSSEKLKPLFANPPCEFSSAPLWVWNDDLSEADVRRTLRDLAEQHVKQAFVHPRPGLMTPYLGEEWFRLWNVALEEARALDMNLWIYDENSYPSGFAGGWVPELMPEAKGRGLSVRETSDPPSMDKDIVAVFARGDRQEDITARLRAGEQLPPSKYQVWFIEYVANAPWYGDRCYVDLLKPGVTEKFIEVTLEAYRKAIGTEFGKRVPGTFTDEPHIHPAGRFPWTDDLPAVFQKRWGYELTDHLPSLIEKVGPWQRVRHNYCQTLLELFIERWARPLHDYCDRHGLELTGHYWEHEWVGGLSGPDTMAMYAWHQRPAIDILFNQYDESVHSQFGNVRAVKELASVANQMGWSRTLCEAYGGGGWDIRFEDLKRIGDWMYALGVNTLDQHLSHISIRGARKRDYPQSFSYHEPWWPAYHVEADYFARLSAALSTGEEVNKVLVLEPTTTLWLYVTEGDRRWEDIAAAFQRLITDLSRQQIEYDLGCEDIIGRYGAVSGKRLQVGKRAYEVVVLPPGVESLNSRTVELLGEYLDKGGKVLCCGTGPRLMDGQASEKATDLARKPGWSSNVERQTLAQALLQMIDPEVKVLPDPVRQGILYHMHRRLGDGELIFLANSSIQQPAGVEVQVPAAGVEEWDLETGKVCARPEAVLQNKLATSRIMLPPSGSILLFFPRVRATAEARAELKTAETLTPGETRIQRLAPNVLTLDYCDVTVGDETKQDTYVYAANAFVWQKHGLKRDPWDEAVQFKDELIKRRFPAESGFTATYRFTIEERIPADLRMVIERADLYDIVCNGRPVKPGAATSAPPAAAKDQSVEPAWWLDRSFRVVDIAAVARLGANEVTIKAAPLTNYHELEAAYLLGDFGLRPAKRGFVIAPRTPLTLGPWNKQGMPLYGHEVTYTQKYDVPAVDGRFTVALGSWYGSMAEVRVNGASAGFIWHQPWELDVTELIKPGGNTVDVIVVGTLKNTLGPHHGSPPLGFASPGSFRVAPAEGPPAGDEYATAGYGLFEPFAVIHRASKAGSTDGELREK
ncbi:MAG TPA: glycosyl hydrolase [Phycisphaerae bacterium]|nr:glycosyl hydrolase [Phycisphaerae bacterium]